MEIQFLGTGAGVPSKGRNVTSIALKLLDELNEVWLFDCGEGTQQQILETHIRPRKINKIFITHLHGDHIFGLPGFLSSRSFQGGDDDLTIYGPKGIRQFVQSALRWSDSHLSYRINFVEVTEPGWLFEDDKFKVYADFLDHRVASLGFRVVEKDRPGELLIDKVREANIPSGPVYAELKQGKTVTLADGRTFDGKQFIAPAQKGRIVTILGDTRQAPVLDQLVSQADVLVHESTFGKDEEKLARNYYHSTSVQAAELAKRNGVKRLLMTHISARYVGKLAYRLQNEARAIFPNSQVVWDFDTFEVPLKVKGDATNEKENQTNTKG